MGRFKHIDIRFVELALHGKLFALGKVDTVYTNGDVLITYLASEVLTGALARLNIQGKVFDPRENANYDAVEKRYFVLAVDYVAGVLDGSSMTTRGRMCLSARCSCVVCVCA